jgi:hypothetical protein
MNIINIASIWLTYVAFGATIVNGRHNCAVNINNEPVVNAVNAVNAVSDNVLIPLSGLAIRPSLTTCESMTLTDP